MVSALEYWIALPQNKCTIVKAMLGDEIVGWSAWAFRGFEPGEVVLSYTPTENTEAETKSPNDETKAKQETSYTPMSQASLLAHEEQIHSLLAAHTPEMKPIERLNATTNLSMTFVNTHLSHPSNTSPHLPLPSPAPTPAKHVCLIALTISPLNQGHGVGASLISFGTSIADAHRVYSWVSSSQDGSGFFAKMGYEEVGRWELDLDLMDYCGGVANPHVEDGKWGVYCWPYMRREARWDVVK